ncbi:MAG: hypothetical protein J6Y28_01705 [Acholeplasmatales bacterium]|nr:hypothetical protein [Methanobrevibacter sp.]MBP5444862.1 hypothetical protein [Acholeplasmatales bacterium]
MKPFNLELAKQGHPVCTRDGKPARIICFDAKHPIYPIIALIENGGSEEPYAFSIDGIYYVESIIKDKDLMMASVKHESWINIYRNENGVITPGRIYESKKEAIKCRMPDTIDTIKIEWEE